MPFESRLPKIVYGARDCDHGSHKAIIGVLKMCGRDTVSHALRIRSADYDGECDSAKREIEQRIWVKFYRNIMRDLRRADPDAPLFGDEEDLQVTWKDRVFPRWRMGEL